MAKRSPLTDKNGEVRELTAEDLKHFKPAAEVLPKELLEVLPKRRPGQRGPGKRPTKEAVNIRLAPEVVEAFRATGRGWQTRINDVLRDWLKEHKPAA
jgi:uncharacterized protein (DUF4415 family)